ncbi:Zinc finger, PHD-type [Gossypium australe]|uniref:Zinc finger, PHD-type n=1 Tax=Gossypium australe TaxID=47621 RepID=A0A5B6V2V7_9ROSI|nr:Zinc finger, PHD-type [Gossypium australe]
MCQWITKELDLLRSQINRANEKGWRREYPFDKVSQVLRVLFHRKTESSMHILRRREYGP